MTKNHSGNILLLMAAFSLIFFLSSCRKDMKQSENTQLISAAKPGGTTSSSIGLSVTFSDAGTDKIKSDNGTPYVNGTVVRAEIDQYGNLQFDTNRGMTRRSGVALRTLTFLFDDPIPEYQSAIPATNPKGNYRLVSTGTNLLTLNGAQDIRLGGGFSSQVASSTDWTFSFRYGAEATSGSSTFATATRVDSNTWTITGTSSSISSLRTNGVVTGYYFMPFSMTLTRL